MVRPESSPFPPEREPALEAWVAEQNARPVERPNPDAARQAVLAVYGDDPIEGLRAAAAEQAGGVVGRDQRRAVSP